MSVIVFIGGIVTIQLAQRCGYATLATFEPWESFTRWWLRIKGGPQKYFGPEQAPVVEPHVIRDPHLVHPHPMTSASPGSGRLSRGCLGPCCAVNRGTRGVALGCGSFEGPRRGQGPVSSVGWDSSEGSGREIAGRRRVEVLRMGSVQNPKNMIEVLCTSLPTD